MKTVHLIHGFNEKHPLQHPKIACLQSYLTRRQHRVMVHDYGHWDLVATRNNKNLARLIFPHIKPGDSIIAFSNGAAITAHLSLMGVEASRIVLIQPALATKWIANPYAKNVTIFYNQGDKATVAGKWYRRATSILPWRWQEKHKWGEMGHVGFEGNDTRYKQYDTENCQQMGLPVCSGHSTWATPRMHAWQEFMAGFA